MNGGQRPPERYAEAAGRPDNVQRFPRFQFGVLWPHSNKTFVPAAELLISIYVWPSVFLT
jgi:hypothetical protein